jgi:type IV pilus assembly protein PilE
MNRAFGFTLIELLTVMTIIGILAAISYPSYTEYVLRAKRADGKVALLKAQLAEEKWRANNTVYGSLTDIDPNNALQNQSYKITVSSISDKTYTVNATPTFTDTKCGTLVINQDSEKTNTGTDSVKNCWGK